MQVVAACRCVPRALTCSGWPHPPSSSHSSLSSSCSSSPLCCCWADNPASIVLALPLRRCMAGRLRAPQLVAKGSLPPQAAADCLAQGVLSMPFGPAGAIQAVDTVARAIRASTKQACERTAPRLQPLLPAIEAAYPLPITTPGGSCPHPRAPDPPYPAGIAARRGEGSEIRRRQTYVCRSQDPKFSSRTEILNRFAKSSAPALQHRSDPFCCRKGRGKEGPHPRRSRPPADLQPTASFSGRNTGAVIPTPSLIGGCACPV